IYLSLVPKGAILLETWYINGVEYKLPAVVSVTRPSTLVAISYVYTDNEGDYYLTIPMVSTNALEVYVNGKKVYSEGYVEGYVNVWTKAFQFPVNLMKSRNDIKIFFHNLHSLDFRKVPYISEKPNTRISLLNFLIDFGSKASLGIAIILGFLLAFMAYKRSHYDYYVNFAHGFVFLGLYMADASFWEFYMSSTEFEVAKRIVYSSIGMAIMFFVLGADMVRFGKVLRKTRILSYPALVLSLFILFYPDFIIVRHVHMLEAPYLILLVIVFWMKMVSYKESVLSYSSLLLMLGAIQYMISVFALSLSIPPVLGYCTTYSSITFTYYLVTQQRRIEDRLMGVNEELFKEPLTGAYNRRMLDDIEINKEDALIFFDLDDFKQINDRYGHHYGDEVLKKFVEIAKRIVRKTDYVIRYGGDEFIIVLRDCDEKKARSVARKITRNFHEKTKAHLSFGVVTGHKDVYDALKAADRVMYRIKKSKKVD
ncbi:MAG: GGDEF domain-containing protein, partial [Thermotogaceae bacterium]|nr:GGDEF domain-containing protein [Thermotogaceae bacterium]